MNVFDAAALARLFRTWLDNPDDRVEAEVRTLATLPEAQWAAVVKADPSLTTIAVTRTLLSLAYDARLRTLDRAVWLAKIAIRVAKDTWSGQAHLDATIEAEGDAWREYAAALHAVREDSLAKFAAQRAHELYALVPGTEKNDAILCLYEGRILHELGESESGLATVERGTNLLRDLFRDDKRYVQGRTMQAAILMDRGDYQEAARVLRSVVQLARDLGDTETYAHITHFIGRCMAKLGQIDEAKKVLGEAVKLFHELGMPTEPPRVRGAIADMLVAAGRYNEAIAELYMARQEFLALNLPVIAALVSLDVVDLLLVQQRTSEVEHLCNEMIRVFTAANLSRNALQALAHLKGLAEQSAVTSEDVQQVRAYLELLPTAPETAFEVQ